MRHRLANALYALAGSLDRKVARCDGEDFDYGDKRDWIETPNATHGNVQIHLTDPDNRISGTFKPGAFTYAALNVGRGVETTFFLNRRSTRKLLAVLHQIDDGFTKYGENRR